MRNNALWSYLLDVRGRGVGRPLLVSLPTAFLTWQAVHGRESWLVVVAVLALWVVTVQEWSKWKRERLR